jgi:hypothetical protein
MDIKTKKNEWFSSKKKERKRKTSDDFKCVKSTVHLYQILEKHLVYNSV